MDPETPKKNQGEGEIQHEMKADIADDFLRIELNIRKQGKLIKIFMTAMDDASLPQDVRNNFGSIGNVCSILKDPKSYVVDPVEGKITLLFNVTFPNGFVSTLTGVLQLVEQQITEEVKEFASHELQTQMEKLKLQVKQLEEQNFLKETLMQKQIDLMKDKILRLENSESSNKIDAFQNRSKTTLLFQEKLQDLHNKMQQQRSYFLDIIDELKENNKTMRIQTKNISQTLLKAQDDNIALKQAVRKLELDKEITGQKFEAYDGKLADIMDSIDRVKGEVEKKSGQSSMSNMEDSQEFSSKKKIPMELLMNTPYFKHFLNNGKYIVYNGSEESTQILGKIAIKQNPVSRLTVAKTKMNQIGFGVLDAQYFNQRSSHKQPNYIMYYGWNGGVYEGGKCLMTQGTGFKGNETVKMVVKPNLGHIRWEVGGIVEAEHNSDKLKDESINWVPFVRMCNPGDSVKWYIEE